MRTQTRHLLLILGDQLDLAAPLLIGADPARDLVWMCEAAEESRHVPAHRARIVLFLSAMRHFRDQLRADGFQVRYLALDEHAHPGLADALAADLATLHPAAVRLTKPGDWRVEQAITGACRAAGLDPTILPDRHFLCDPADFDAWAARRRELRLEHFYRFMRRRHDVLMDGDQPIGGAWNFDQSNRRAFGKQGPGLLPAPLGFAPDPITRAVMELVSARFPQAPGGLAAFDWPVTAADAERALGDFINHRLAAFGPFQDAMWRGEPWLYHARLSAAMNLKLISPARVIDGAVTAWRAGRAPIASVEGFVRQVLGWREYIRGVYWRSMPGYLDVNALGADQPLPGFYWTGDTDCACLRETIGGVLARGYAHHIQRLMVTGLYCLLLGVRPQAVHEWYLAMFVDAVEWVEAPNTLGMSQYADGGLLASKPYAASGAYLQRMSNYCTACRYDPKQAEGPRACPFTTLFWDFLARHRERFANHPRTALMWRNLDRLDPGRLAAIRDQAARLRGAA